MFRTETIATALKELDRVTEELAKHRGVTLEELEASLSRRWTIERGLIAGANLVFDTADHILSSRFHVYPETYEDSLRLLRDNSVISEELYGSIKGLGGFRNILVHEYLGIDMAEEYRNFQKALKVFRDFAREILIFIGSSQ